jgi:hypothetical protein
VFQAYPMAVLSRNLSLFTCTAYIQGTSVALQSGPRTSGFFDNNQKYNPSHTFSIPFECVVRCLDSKEVKASGANNNYVVQLTFRKNVLHADNILRVIIVLMMCRSTWSTILIAISHSNNTNVNKKEPAKRSK